jgi:RNA polymerase sigma-70 factor (ECF subfamily)
MDCPVCAIIVLEEGEDVSTPTSRDVGDFARALVSARAGVADELGRLLMDCRNYLLLVADRRLGDDLRGKVSPSDVVQETFLEAQRDFARFDGQREDELLAWLSCILLNNVANARRKYRGTDKRSLDREVEMGANDGLIAGGVVADTPSPGARVVASEEEEALRSALEGLPERYQQVLRLRYHEQMTFAGIGAALGCSEEAARKLWARAVDRLQKGMGSSGEP